jgi:hypothetical protein
MLCGVPAGGNGHWALGTGHWAVGRRRLEAPGAKLMIAGSKHLSDDGICRLLATHIRQRNLQARRSHHQPDMCDVQQYATARAALLPEHASSHS